jgi:hypothetical protein
MSQENVEIVQRVLFDFGDGQLIATGIALVA